MQTARPTIPTNTPSIRPGSQAPTATVYPANQPIMMAMAPMPFPSPQAAQYYIPQVTQPLTRTFIESLGKRSGVGYFKSVNQILIYFALFRQNETLKSFTKIKKKTRITRNALKKNFPPIEKNTRKQSHSHTFIKIKGHGGRDYRYLTIYD